MFWLAVLVPQEEIAEACYGVAGQNLKGTNLIPALKYTEGPLSGCPGVHLGQVAQFLEFPLTQPPR